MQESSPGSLARPQPGLQLQSPVLSAAPVLGLVCACLYAQHAQHTQQHTASWNHPAQHAADVWALGLRKACHARQRTSSLALHVQAADAGLG